MASGSNAATCDGMGAGFKGFRLHKKLKPLKQCFKKLEWLL
ncbi:hypothetical protein CCACVL1_01715 [Corchorus capsularis]|uniref:Uncharacterized protein n=1 Tax=Corchorus capsularis TaxID=210143 RepID=A0A1R3KG85_COCAP|nr:hypothetical protein CCACVL1_01715 [Corchorus capsularis]